MNIFYTQVDTNLQKELNARANAAFDRTTGALNFMLGKFANVELSAYDGQGPAVDDSKLIHVLGGSKIWGEDYNAGGKDGFLNQNKNQSTPTGLEWNWNPKDKKLWSTNSPTDIPNVQLRIPPFISSADIQIGDNSMGLLNTANVVIEIPNAQRDLDMMEEIYMRPGRYAKLKFIHDPSTLVSYAETNGLLSGSIPSDDKLKELYPGVDLNAKKTEIRRMNQVTFEGLITNFDFSYQKDFSVQLQIQLRGTSNVFTDVSMFIDAQGSSPGKETKNPIADPETYNASINLKQQNNNDPKKDDPNAPKRKSFYEYLFENVDNDYKTSFIRKNETSTFEIVDPNTNQKKQLQANRLDKKNGTIHTDQYFLCGNAWSQSALNKDTQSTFQRYITLGYLIDFINEYVLRGALEDGLKKEGKIVKNAQIICSDKFCFSNYYPFICSIDPLNILLLPGDSNRGTTETYATEQDVKDGKTTVKKVFFEDTKSVDNSWQGVTGSPAENRKHIYPSRIFINLELIQNILAAVEKGGSTNFKVSDFLAEISSQILNATSGAISLKLITHPEDQTVLAFYDEKFIGTPEDKLSVKEYTIPMSSTGTVVHDFQLKASLPENVSSLSYVLNQDPERISTEDIAPYINYMYNSNDPTKKTAAEKLHETQHNKAKAGLIEAKIKFSQTMTDVELKKSLDVAQKAYLQYPTPDRITSLQSIAPIIPFDITFTIDGIHGFRYGDVVTFDVLPEKYKVNTVFSIVGVNHQVSQDSTWTTEIRCIMRPRVNG